MMTKDPLDTGDHAADVGRRLRKRAARCNTKIRRNSATTQGSSSRATTALKPRAPAAFLLISMRQTINCMT
jgi:hypothetical protein